MEPLRKTVTLTAMPRANFPQRFLCALALIFSALLCGCEDHSRTARDAAQDLARLFSERKFTEAYAQTAPAFQFRRSENYFGARLIDLGLCDARGVKWGEPERNGHLATVRGIFMLRDEGRLPLNFIFSLEDGTWRLIEARSIPGPGGVAEDVFAVAARTRDTVNTKAVDILEPVATEIPAEPQLRQLVEDTLLLFNEAIQNGGDFSALYAAASDRWKYRGRKKEDLEYVGPDPGRTERADPLNRDDRLTIGALRTAFASHVEAKVDLSPIRGKKMILTSPPRVNSDGVLNLYGTFEADVFQPSAPARPRRVGFKLEYVREAGWWKLMGLTVNLFTVEPSPKPGTKP